MAKETKGKIRQKYAKAKSFISLFTGPINTVGGVIGIIIVVAVLTSGILFSVPKYKTWVAKEEAKRVEYEEIRIRKLGAALRDFPQYIELQKVENE